VVTERDVSENVKCLPSEFSTSIVTVPTASTPLSLLLTQKVPSRD
jgi:hypothetical protein